MSDTTQPFLNVVYGVLQPTLGAFFLLFLPFLLPASFFNFDTTAGLRRLASSVALPALALVVLGSEINLALIRRAWPIAAITAIVQVLSLFVSYLFYHRVCGLPGWVISSASFGSLSLPLLVLAGMSKAPAMVLRHLSLDENASVELLVRKGAAYLILISFVSEVIRVAIAPFLPTTPAIALPIEDNEDSMPIYEDEEDSADALPTEQSSLLSKPTSPSASSRIFTRFNAFLAFSVLGLVVALVPGAQKLVFGNENAPAFVGSTIGSAAGLLGGVFAVLEVVGAGASLKLGDGSGKEAKTLGAVLAISFWKLAAVPALTTTLAWAFGKLVPTEPILAFSLVLFHSLPSLSPISPSSSYQSRTATQVSLIAPFLASFAAAASIAVAGSGVVFESDVDWKKAGKAALGGGIAGAAAMILQVLTLMPLRTTINHQYRFGGGLKATMRKLWNEGKLPRFYAGLGAALFQGPLSRFGDTFANAGIMALTESLAIPVFVKTVFSSLASATFRMTLTPIDTLKTTQQTQGGRAGLQLLRQRIREQGVASLWYGALGAASASFVGNYPWFFTYNWLSTTLPLPHTAFEKLSRQAFIGFVASVISDTVSNSLRVVKTYRQVSEGNVGYIEAAREIVRKDGWGSLFGRGLGTKILSNGLQGLMFSVLWRFFQDLIAGKGV